ncbi:Gfo/Idh/MocA family protein [Legionella shakespearei]|uniref:Oxidoreductase n=1 Tax=Legionella shakespearei DSM 23087 TaxID=1122169 RepID=A0A0W0YHT7_9GAMM|nr:oxidoreductase [Legionella shakespearei DSM 23087]
MSGKITWGILGTSFISEVMAKAIHASTSSELLAVGSRSLSSAKHFAEQHQISKAYGNFQSLLDDPAIDAIYIGLPNHVHKEWIIRCALAGKHILCEKPFVLNAAEAHEVLGVLEETRVFCMEALMYRCHPFSKKLQELVQSKILGDIRLYNAVYTAPIAHLANPVAGGSIRNLGCYPVSLIRLLAGAEPVEIIGTGRWNKDNQTDSQASVILKFADHSIATVSTADDFAMVWQFDIWGSEGHLKVISNPWLPDAENKCIIQRYDEKEPVEIRVSGEKPLYTYQIDTVNHCILKSDMREQEAISLSDSLGNSIVLESWLNQI